MLKIAIIIGSTRPGRNSEAVARWVYDISKTRSDAEFDLVDVADFNLPLIDEPYSSFATALLKLEYAKEHTKVWSAKIQEFDGYVFITPEYNHGIPAALKNAVDYLYGEWHNKAAGFVGFGGSGATRSIEQLRLVLSELQVATVRNEVNLSLLTDFENYRVFKPAPFHEQRVNAMLDQLIAWSGALKALRPAAVSSSS